MAHVWTEKLQCRKCGASGRASVSQADDWATPTATAVPDGFKAVRTENSLDFHCVRCGVAVKP
jgi:hypothetical protein